RGGEMREAPPLEPLHQIGQTCLEGGTHRMTLHDIAYQHGSRLRRPRGLRVAEGRTDLTDQHYRGEGFGDEGGVPGRASGATCPPGRGSGRHHDRRRVRHGAGGTTHIEAVAVRETE